jgi:choline kinase
MSDLIVLAAGRGARFGGLKQLASVGPTGEAILDVLMRRAAAAGFARAVLVVRDGIVEEVRSHLAARRPAVAVHLVCQAPIRPGGALPGTGHAVLSCRGSVEGPFAVVNADDLYPDEAFRRLGHQLHSVREHVCVAFPVAQTLIGARPVSRAVVDLDGEARLVAIEEGTVRRRPDGLRFDARDGSRALTGNEWVSMNMWGFQPSIFDTLDGAVASHLAAGHPGEVNLPDHVASVVATGRTVRCVPCGARCIGLTYPEDVAVVSAALA